MSPSVRRGAFALAIVFALTGAMPVAAAPIAPTRLDAAQAAQVVPATRAENTFTNIFVTGTLPLDHVFRGRLDVRNFRAINDQLYATGRLSGRILNSDGVVLRRISDVWVRLPVTIQQPALSAQGTACDILTLVLGPLHLDVLGLVIDLNRINLRITADPGPGNLLGNLLCAIAGLLDPPGPLDVLANLLRSVLFIVNQL